MKVEPVLPFPVTDNNWFGSENKNWVKMLKTV